MKPGIALFAQNVRDELNQSPIVKYGVLILMFGVGIFLIVNGIRGVRDKQTTMTSRHRTTEFTGDQAVMAGYAQIGMGILFIIVSTLVTLFR